MMGNNNTNTIVLSNNWDWDYQIGIAYTPGSIGVAGGVLQIGQLTKNNANYTHGITALFTSGVERLRVNNIGNVGINVTNPTYKLQVAGNFAFDGGLSTRMLVSYTNLTNTEDWQNSPISIRERDLVSNTLLADKYGPNLNFHWASRVSKSIWMDANGLLNWGEYDANGIPYADGTFKTATLLATTSVGVGTTIPSGLLHAYISDARYFTFSNTAAFTIQRNVITTAGATPILSLINTQGMDASTNRGTSIQLDLGYGGNGTNLVGTAARGARIAALNDTVYDSTAANQNASLVFYTATGGSLTEKLRIQGDNKVGIGVTSPVTLLSVGGAGSTSAASGITFGADASANLYRDTTSRIRTDGAFISSSYIFAGTYLQTSNGNIFPANFSTDIVLNVGNAAANNWETYPFTLKKGGYVGIGTNIPSGKLHVVSSVANETVLRADGTNGILFSVVDDLSDSLMSVNNSAGLPVLEVFANDRVVMGQYGANDFVLINNKIGLGTNNPQYELDIVGAGTNAAVNIITRMRSTAGSDVFNTASVLAFTNTTTNSNAYSYIGGRIDLASAGDNAQSLVFATNATNTLPTEKMRITSAGNVGIGSTDPQYKLDVYAGVQDVARFYNNQTNFGLILGSTNNTLYTNLVWTTSNGNVQFFKNRSSTSWGGADSMNLYSSNGGFAFHANGAANSVNITTAGNVGIGGSSPSQKLDVKGYIVSDVNSNGVEAGFFLGGNAHGMRRAGGVNDIRVYTTAGNVIIGANGSGSQHVTVLSNGTVGIGTASTVGKLDLYDDTDGGHVSFVRNNNAGSNAYTAIVLRRNGDLNGLVMFTNSSNRSTDGGLGNSTIRTDNGKLLLGAGATTYHSLETNGNVGIGITNPNAARLHIKGDTTNPVIRVETNLIEGPAGGTAGRTLRGWLPIMTGANAGDKVYIPLYGPLN
jgi:hypothetical protein